jgi:DNA polymerase elongation subunit (family B)
MGNHIYLRGFDEDKKRIQRKFVYEPYVFVSSDKQSPYKDIMGMPVTKRNFNNIADARSYIDQHENISGFNLYGLTRWQYVYINDEFANLVYDRKAINIVFFDIEVESDDGFPNPEDAEKKISAISLRKDDLRIALGYGDYEHNEPNTYYIKCKSEADLIRKFLNVYEQMDPDVLSGWNIEFFDIPYLINRITKILGKDFADKLSPWLKIKKRAAKFGFKELETYDIFGVSILDYLSVYKKFQLEPRESYKLDYICEVELNENKIDYSEYSSLFSLYKENHQKFIEYSLRDSDLVYRLDQKMGYFDQIFTIAYDAGINYNDALTSVLLWEIIIHNHLLKHNTVIPLKSENHHDKNIVGGYVKEPQTGLHNWVVSFDLNSLYPHLIQQYNISPDTHIAKISNEHVLKMSCEASVDSLLEQKVDTNYLKVVDLTMTPNGQFYRRNVEGFLPHLMRKKYEDRVLYKNKMIELKKQYEKTPTRELNDEISRYHNLQLAIKIMLNSVYGALANKYFRFYNPYNAEAITTAGQLSIRWIENDLNVYLNSILKTKGYDYVIASDTDSVYLCFDKLVSEVFFDQSDKQKIIDYLNKVVKTKIEPFIEESYQRLAEYVNARSQKMVMKRENIADKAIWQAKKRYIMNVYDEEGFRYSEPKLKIMGIEAIRSSTPSVYREFIKESLKIIMNQTENDLQKYIKELKDQNRKFNFEDIAFPRSVNFTSVKTLATGGTYIDTYEDKNTIYKKGSPIQVKGALIYNHLIDKHKLNKKYQKISDGEKIKFSYLIVPNIIQDTVIASSDILPVEFGLHKYIDYDTQFEKGYLTPIKGIIDTINWKIEKQSTLEDFFS